MPVEVPLVGDAKTVLQALLPQVSYVDRPEWMGYIGELKRDHPSLAVPPSDTLRAQHVLVSLNELLRESRETVVVTGVGQHQMWAAQFLSFNHSNTFVSSGGLGAMGFELPAALGAQVGRPDATVWTVAGDGGFQMTSQELATAVEAELPVKIVLINNGHLGMVRQWQELFFENHLKAVPVPGPDYVKLAHAYGIPAVRVTEQEDVLPAMRQAQAHDGPFLLEFITEPSGKVYPMVPPGGSLADTMEDPLLQNGG